MTISAAPPFSLLLSTFVYVDTINSYNADDAFYDDGQQASGDLIRMPVQSTFTGSQFDDGPLDLYPIKVHITAIKCFVLQSN